MFNFNKDKKYIIKNGKKDIINYSDSIYYYDSTITISYNKEDKNYFLDIRLGVNATISDLEPIEKILSSYLYKDSNYKIYSYFMDNDRIDYYYFKSFLGLSSHNVAREDIIRLITILIKDKNNVLSGSDALMMDEYKTFNLKNLLLSKQNGFINNNNSGLIIIDKDKTITKSCTKETHLAEANYQIDSEVESLNKYSNDTNTIFIQVALYIVVIWLPDDVNKYQYMVLKDILDVLKKYSKDNDFIINLKHKNITANKINSVDEYVKRLNLLINK